VRPPDDWRQARATLAIAGATAVAWLLAVGAGIENYAAIWGGFIPVRLSSVAVGAALAPLPLTPLTATLVHAGFVHLFLNLLILLFCGRAVETLLGMRGLVILYLAGAYAAAAAHYVANPMEATPMVGASGAISAVVGAYAMMFGRNRVKVANPSAALWLNALWLAVAWVGLQLMVGITFTTAGSRIAIMAHIGGFLVGLMLAKPLLLLRYRGA
jgi:membrane associated rhomboid family serine protease